MTVSKTQNVHSFEKFFAYMIEAESHNGIDPRYVTAATRGPVSIGSARADFRRLTRGHKPRVEGIATLHSSAPGECEMIARLIEGEMGLGRGTIDKHDALVVERYMQMVLTAEDRAAPGTAAFYAAQIDGDTGLLHVHGLRVNTLLRDVEVPVTRRTYERDEDGKIRRDERGVRIPARDAIGRIIYENTVETAKKGHTLPPSMRDSLRLARVTDEVWHEHGINNERIVTKNVGRTYKDRAREFLVQLEANRTAAMDEQAVIDAIKAAGHDARMRGKKKPVLTLDFMDGGSKHTIRIQNLSTDDVSLDTSAFLARMQAPVPVPVKAVEKTVETITPQPVKAAAPSSASSRLDALTPPPAQLEGMEDADAENARIVARRTRSQARAALDEVEAPSAPAPAPVEPPAAVSTPSALDEARRAAAAELAAAESEVRAEMKRLSEAASAARERGNVEYATKLRQRRKAITTVLDDGAAVAADGRRVPTREGWMQAQRVVQAQREAQQALRPFAPRSGLFEAPQQTRSPEDRQRF